jgi:hypothetical protein
MAQRVVMVHTVGSLPATFDALCAELLPGVQIEHVVDESLLRETMEVGALTDAVRTRFAARARDAHASGPDAVVLTCSSVGPAADGLDVYRIDQAMADRAVELGTRIGVAATVPTTLGPTSELIERAGRAAGRAVEVHTRLVEGAFDALRAGRLDEHDRLVLAGLNELGRWAEVVVLAQASMARALAGAATLEAAGRTVPVLSSPRLGVERLRDVLRGQRGSD